MIRVSVGINSETQIEISSLKEKPETHMYQTLIMTDHGGKWRLLNTVNGAGNKMVPHTEKD